MHWLVCILGLQDAEEGLAEASAISQQKAKEISDMQAAITAHKCVHCPFNSLPTPLAPPASLLPLAPDRTPP